MNHLLKMVVRQLWEAPHVEEVSPVGVAWHPRNAGVKWGMTTTILSSTDDQPSPRQDGEAVPIPGCGRSGMKEV